MSQSEIGSRYTFAHDLSMGMLNSSTSLLQPLQLVAKQETSTPNNIPQTLPLLQPIDLSRFNTFYATPVVPHNSLPLSSDRLHHQTPSSSPHTGSPPLSIAHSTYSQSTFSSPEWELGHRATRSFGDLNSVMHPMNMLFDPAQGSGVGSVMSTPVQGRALLPDFRGYQYAQPLEAWGSAPASEEDEKDKANQRNRRHVCPVCDKRFNRPSSLSTHMAVHTGAKPYQCRWPECGRCFSVSSNLRRHERTHENHKAKERMHSSDPFELLTTTPVPFRPPSSSHAHPHSTGSHSYAYPAPPTYDSYPTGHHQQTQPLGGYPFETTTQTLDLLGPTLTQTPLPSGMSSGFGHIGVGGLEQYSITRRSSSGESRESSVSGMVTTPRSPLEGYDLISNIRESEVKL